MKHAVLPQLLRTLRLLALVLAVFAVLAVGMPQRMHAMMAMDAPEAAMAMDHSAHMGAADAMAKGAAHLACDVLCVGTLVDGAPVLPTLQSRLGVLAFLPMALRSVKAQSPDPALRPPQSALIA
jgi:hypothetical protein